MSLENKLTYLNGTKEAIKQAIIDKGVSVTEADTFRSYATKIGEIQGGGTETKYTGHADVEGLKAIGWTDEDIQYYQENGVNWNEEDDEYHKVPQENIDLYGVLNENNIQTYKDLIVYLPKIEITKTDCSMLFASCYSMVAIPMLDFSICTQVYRLFYNCYSLVSIPLINISKSSYYYQLFYNCYSLVSLPQIDFSNATNTEGMFYYCYSLKTLPNLNLVNIESSLNMFSNCYSLVSLPQIDFSNATNTVSTFYNCYSLVSLLQIDLSNSNNNGSIFNLCYSLQHIKINNLKTNLSINESALLSKESLLYMIQNAAPTSAITITLHSNVYDKYIEDPDIVSALSAQPNITLAK